MYFRRPTPMCRHALHQSLDAGEMSHHHQVHVDVQPDHLTGDVPLHLLPSPRFRYITKDRHHTHDIRSDDVIHNVPHIRRHHIHHHVLSVRFVVSADSAEPDAFTRFRGLHFPSVEVLHESDHHIRVFDTYGDSRLGSHMYIDRW